MSDYPAIKKVLDERRHDVPTHPTREQLEEFQWSTIRMLVHEVWRRNTDTGDSVGECLDSVVNELGIEL